MTVSEQEAARIASKMDEARTRMVVPGGAFILDEPEEVPALWGFGHEVLWAEGEGFMIAGHQGLGKTTIAQQLVLAMIGVRGDSFLGLPVKQIEGRVLYLAMDRPRQAARSFRRMVAEDARAALDERLTIWKGPLPVDPTITGAFAEWAQEVCPGCAVIVVDSVKDLAPGVNGDEVGSAINIAWQSVIAEGIELLLLHHQRKASNSSTRETTLDSVYGSTWLTSGLGSVALLEGQPGSDEVTLHHAKQPGDVVGPLDIIHDHPLGRSTLHEEPVRLSVEAALGMAPPGGGHTVAEVAGLTGLAEKTVRARIKELDEAGRAEKVGGGKNTSGGRVAVLWRLAQVQGQNQWS